MLTMAIAVTVIMPTVTITAVMSTVAVLIVRVFSRRGRGEQSPNFYVISQFDSQLTARVMPLRICPGQQEHLCDVDVSVLGSQMQRRFAVRICCIRISSHRQQHTD